MKRHVPISHALRALAALEPKTLCACGHEAFKHDLNGYGGCWSGTKQLAPNEPCPCRRYRLPREARA